MQKISVGIREAKINLSKLLHEIKKGKEVILTDRGTPVAKITTIEEKDLSLAERIKILESNGLIEPVVQKSMPIPPPLPLEAGKAQEFLQEDRS